MSKKVMTSLLNCGLETDSKFPLLKTRQLLGLFFLSNNDQSVPDTSAWAAAFCPWPFGDDCLGIVQGKQTSNPRPQQKTTTHPKRKPQKYIIFVWLSRAGLCLFGGWATELGELNIPWTPCWELLRIKICSICYFWEKTCVNIQQLTSSSLLHCSYLICLFVAFSSNTDLQITGI